MEAGTVAVAYLHPGEISHSFSDSLMRLIAHDIAHEGRVVRTGGPLMFRCGPGGLVEARNQVVAHFLDNMQAEWLWCIDSDMGFAPDTVDRLVDAADPIDRPVVGGLCFALGETVPDGMSGFLSKPFPTLFSWGRREPDGEVGYTVLRTYPVNTLVQVAGTGAACLLIHRSIAEKIRTAEGDAWFDRVVYPNSRTRVAEDLSFCYRVNAVGSPVFVHTGIRTTHHKSFHLNEADFWSSYVAPPASERVAVLVPVLRRPHNAEPFMGSLRASTGLATAYAIASWDDVATQDAWRTAGAEVIVGSAETFAEKVNASLAHCTEPWLFITGDDVLFRPGWLDHTQHIASIYGAKVVGTNDLGHPRVLAGEHATHLLVARDYVDEVGASWDGPGVVCHEGYRHWYVDDEIVTVAKQRDVWAMSLGSIVEHLHPSWGKALIDEVYELGQASADADRRLFIGRRGSHLHDRTGVPVGTG